MSDIKVTIKLSTGKKIELNEAELGELKTALERLTAPNLRYWYEPYTPVYPYVTVNTPSITPYYMTTTCGNSASITGGTI